MTYTPPYFLDAILETVERSAAGAVDMATRHTLGWAQTAVLPELVSSPDDL